MPAREPTARAAAAGSDLTVVALSHRPRWRAGGALIVVTDDRPQPRTRGAPRSSVAYRLSLDKRLDARDPRLAGNRR